MMEVHDYTYIFVLGMFFAFLDAFGIGANDVSNSFSGAVGSGALTLKQAVLIASVCEFAGAFLVGSSTTDTIKGGIIDVNVFSSTPELLMLLMVCALVGSSTWVLFASSRGWPVSTTHAIVGAIIGGGIAGYGWDVVKWSGVVNIVVSWVTSPLVAGVITTIIFMITKKLILTQVNSLSRGFIAIPFYFAITLFINVFYIIFKGSPGLNLDDLPIGVILGISFGVAVAVYLWTQFFLVPYLKRKLQGNEDLKWYHAFYIPFVPHRVKPEMAEIEEAPSTKETKDSEISLESQTADNEEGQVNPTLIALDDTTPVKKSMFSKFKSTATKGMTHNIKESSTEVSAMHELADKYDPDTERLFVSLQVLSSCFASFAHGSNDVANAIGPLATIVYIWQNASVDTAGSPVPAWVLAYGGIAIDLGLLTFGYRVMASLGNNLCFLSPSRGFSTSIGASITVLTCSKLGLPVSTTHCITGATTAVGLCSGAGMKSVNWKLLGLIATSWLLTLPAAAVVSGCLYAIIIYAPHMV